MNIQVNIHPKKDDEIRVKELCTDSGTTFPVINLGFDVSIFPTMEHLEELHTKIGEFLKAQEVAE